MHPNPIAALVEDRRKFSYMERSPTSYAIRAACGLPAWPGTATPVAPPQSAVPRTGVGHRRGHVHAPQHQ